MRQVDRALVNLEDLIRTLLDISKLDAGVMRPDISVFEIDRVIGPLRQEFEPLAATRGLQLHIRASDAVVRSDPLMLRRILQNLLNNALRYTHRGGVLLGCRKRGDRLRIEIVDTGPGIPADRSEAIFEEFQRDAVASAEHGGFGLGLSIVRRLALALEHPLDLASRVGHGSVFAISAPLDNARAIMPPASAHRPTLAAYGLDAASILLVENEPSVAQAMKALLERWGCRVVTAASGGEARDTLRAKGRRPDLIIADLHLDNGERGFDAISAVQSEYRFSGARLHRHRRSFRRRHRGSRDPRRRNPAKAGEAGGAALADGVSIRLGALESRTVIARERSDEAIQTEPHQDRHGLLRAGLKSLSRRRSARA